MAGAAGLPQRPSEPALGALVGGRFAIVREIARGGMGLVYEAEDTATRASVALKVIRPEYANERDLVERFRREAELLESLDDDGIVRIFAHGSLGDGALYIALELLRGETLAQRLKRVGPLEPAELLPIVRGICRGLDAAHARGIVHRDLKPANIFLPLPPDGQPDDVPVKLVDFGVSLGTDLARLTLQGEVLGTPRYMSPEQLGAERGLDARADVYSAGVVLYEALTGHTPYPTVHPAELVGCVLSGRITPPRAFKSDISDEIQAVVMRALALAREQRYATARDLATGFANAAMASVRPVRRWTQRIDRTGPIAVFLGAGISTLDPEDAVPTMRRPPESERPPAAAAPARFSSPTAPVPLVARSGGPRESAPTVPAPAPAPRSRHLGWWIVGASIVGALLVAMIGLVVAATRSDDAVAPQTFPSSVGLGTSVADDAAASSGASPSPAQPSSPPTTLEETNASGLVPIPAGGLVRIESEPPGASIVAGGDEIGVAPHDVMRPATGSTALELVLEGYETGHVSVSKTTGDVVRITLVPTSFPGARGHGRGHAKHRGGPPSRGNERGRLDELEDPFGL